MLEKAVIVWARIRRDTNDDARLRNAEGGCPMHAIPPGKHHRVVRVRFATYLRVVNAVHSGRNKHEVQHTLEPDRQAQIAVVEDCAGLKHQLVGGKHPQWQTSLRAADCRLSRFHYVLRSICARNAVPLPAAAEGLALWSAQASRTAAPNSRARPVLCILLTPTGPASLRHA